MSGYGKSRPRRWLKRGPCAASATEDDAKEQRIAATRVAVALGWCPSCGVHVDEARGNLHDRWCPDVPAERKRAG